MCRGVERTDRSVLSSPDTALVRNPLSRGSPGLSRSQGGVCRRAVQSAYFRLPAISSPLKELTVRRSVSAFALPLTFACVSGLLAIPSQVAAQGLMAEMHTTVGDVQKKLVDLAKAIPESAYGWRPSAGVRTVGEVFKHVASDNYLLPIMMGAPAPASSGISATDMKTVRAYEMRPMTKEQVVAELEASFNHLHGAMRLTTDANLTEMIKFFGSDWSRQKAMLLTVVHLHEHLGQAIAYARSNNVVPPWSK